MDNRRRKGRRARQSRPRGSIASAKVALVCAWAALLVTGCTTFVDGRGVSILNDPFRVAGLPAVDGPSGSRPDGPEPTGTVDNTNGGAIDTLALLSINDIEEYWKQAYGQPLHGSFTPVKELVSYDSDSPDSPALCRSETYRNVNAFFTSRCDVIAWDRGVFMPVGVEMFGDMFIPGRWRTSTGTPYSRWRNWSREMTPPSCASSKPIVSLAFICGGWPKATLHASG